MKQGVRISQTQEDKVVQLARTYPTIEEIGKQIGISARTVARALRRRGIQRPPRRTRAQGDTADQAGIGVTDSLFSEFRKLATIIEKQLSVPAPGTPLRHPDLGAGHTRDLVETGFQGETGPVMEIFRAGMTPGWWRSDGVPQVRIQFHPQDQAIFERFMKLESSKPFEGALKDWMHAAEAYLQVERSSASDGNRRKAYSEAQGAGENASKLLWGGVESVRPS